MKKDYCTLLECPSEMALISVKCWKPRAFLEKLCWDEKHGSLLKRVHIRSPSNPRCAGRAISLIERVSGHELTLGWVLNLSTACVLWRALTAYLRWLLTSIPDWQTKGKKIFSQETITLNQVTKDFHRCKTWKAIHTLEYAERKYLSFPANLSFKAKVTGETNPSVRLTYKHWCHSFSFCDVIYDLWVCMWTFWELGQF